MSYIKRTGKGKLAARIIIAVMCVIIAFALTVALGNHLKNRVGNSAGREENNAPGDISATATDDVPKNDYILKADVPKEQLQKNSTYFYPSELSERDALYGELDRLKENGFDSFSIVLRDDELTLLYASDTLAEEFGIKFDSALPTNEAITAMIDYAHKRGLTVTAVFECSDIFADSNVGILGSPENTLRLDMLLIREIAALGFNEIILTGIYEGVGLTYANAEIFLSYLTMLRGTAPNTFFGVIMDETNFRDVTYAPQIERINKYVDILILDVRHKILSDDTAASVIADISTTLAGSISLYNLRVMIDPTVAYEAQRTALSEHQLVNIQEIPIDIYTVPATHTPTVGITE